MNVDLISFNWNNCKIDYDDDYYYCGGENGICIGG